MEIYKYFNSKDVADYLKKIDYQFSPLEMAWIIWHKKGLNIRERHSAWNELISSTNDCEIPKRRSCEHYDSLREFLKDYMQMELNNISEFTKNDGIFSYEIYDVSCEEISEEYSNNYVFDDYESCFKDGYDMLKFEKLHPGSLLIINKKQKDKDTNLFSHDSSITIDINGEFVDVVSHNKYFLNQNYRLALVFDGMWFSLPTPFKLGDIVIDSINKKATGFCKGPFIIEDTVSNKKTDWMLKDGDTTDMNAWGYFADEDGNIYREVVDNYIDLEYYKGPLTDNLKTFKCVSNYLKGNISLEEVLRYYHIILLEEHCKSSKKWLPFSDEGLKLGGIIDEK